MTDPSQQQQQQQQNGSQNKDESAELYSLIAEQKTEKIDQSMMRPGSRRAVFSPYARNSIVFAAFDVTNEDEMSRLRSQTIAHEQGKVSEEAAKRTAVQTDALFGIKEKQDTGTPRFPPTAQNTPTPTAPTTGTSNSADSNAGGVSSPVTPSPGASVAVVPPTTPSSTTAPTGQGQGDGCVSDEDDNLRIAPLEGLIDRLTMLKHADANFNRDFITTYKLFTTSEKLFDMLIARFNPTPPEGLTPEETEAFWKDVTSTRIRIFIFLTTWVNTMWNSSTPKPLVDKMNAFLEEATKTQKGACEKLSRTLKKALTDDESKGPFMFDTKLPKPILPLNMILGAPCPEVSVCTIHPKEIARQMSLIEQNMFRAVKPWELQNLAFSKKDKTLAPNVNAITRHFNVISQWFACEILTKKNLEERVRVAELVLDTAEYCRQLQNYNALNEIISALNTSAVFRLKKTWAGLSQHHTKLFSELSELMSNKHNYQNLRHQLHDVQPPFVPYLGVYLTDLTFIEEGNPTMHDDLVNWNKCRLQAKVIVEIQTYQQTPYALQVVPWIRDYFLNIKVPYSADDQWKMSIEIEPKNQTSTTSTTSTSTTSTATTSTSASALAPASAPAPTTPTATAAATTTALTPVVNPPPSLPVFVPLSPLPSESSGASSLSTSPMTIPSLPDSCAGSSEVFSPTLPMATNVSDGSSGALLCAGDNSSEAASAASSLPSSPLPPVPEPLVETTLTVRVFPPGCSQRVTLNVPSTMHVADMFDRILSDGKKEGLEMSDQNKAKQLTLIAPGSRSATQGLQFQGMMTVGDTLDSNRGQNTFALFRDLALNGVILLEGPNSYQVLTYVDADSMLYTNAVIIDDIFQRCGEFSFMMSDGKKELSWLNYNNSLAEQGFDQNTCFLVMFPLQRFTGHSSSEDRERSRNGRSMQKIPASPDSKSGYLTVWSTKSLSRAGIILRPQTPQSSQSSQSLTSSGSLSLSTRSLLSLSSRGGDKKKFVAVDNFLMCFNDDHSAFPQNVWALDQCDISLGTHTSGCLCIVIKRNPLSPFNKKSKCTVITGPGDAMTRQWYELLQKKSRYNSNKRVFSKSLTELAMRPGATSFVPQFVREGFELLFRSSLTNPTLFTASVRSQDIDRVRDAINHGTMPALNNPSDEAALAQSILSFYAEMPESLIPGSLFSDIWSYYVDTLKAGTPVVDRLKELLLKLPVPNQVNLKYLLSFFAIWSENSRSGMALPELLGSYLIRLGGEDVPVSFKGQTTDVILKIFEDFLSLMDQLPFPTDENFAKFVENNNSSGTVLRVPVTALDAEDVAAIKQSLENSHLVLDFDDIAPLTPTSSSHKHSPSTYGGAGACDADSEGRSHTDSGGSSHRPAQDGFEDDAELAAEGALDSPRKDKHSSTRVKASQFFRKFRQSFSTKKKSHMSSGSVGTPDDDGSEGCGTPTGSNPNQDQKSETNKSDDSKK